MDRFVLQLDDDKEVVIFDRITSRILDNKVEIKALLNKLNNDLNQARAGITELNEVTGQTIEEIIYFHKVME